MRYDLPPGSYPHDVAPAADGTVWYADQYQGLLGRFDPKTGKVEQIPLGRGSAPHGVIVAGDGAVWLTDDGQNAMVRVDPATRAVKAFPLPKGFANANLNTPVATAVVRFDPATETFESFRSDRKDANVRQLAGRPGEVWGGESGTARLVVVRE